MMSLCAEKCGASDADHTCLKCKLAEYGLNSTIVVCLRDWIFGTKMNMRTI